MQGWIIIPEQDLELAQELLGDSVIDSKSWENDKHHELKVENLSFQPFSEQIKQRWGRWIWGLEV